MFTSKTPIVKLCCVAASFLFCGSYWAAADPACAIGYGGIGCRPAFPSEDNPRTEDIFVHNLFPEQVQNDGVEVINNTNEEKTILVYAVDSTPSTDGGFACKQLSEPKIGVGRWIELEKDEVTLSPQTTTVVPFTITVPEEVDVGEHNGCIVAQEKKTETTDQASGVQLSFRTALRIALKIPGQIVKELKILGLEVQKQENGGYFVIPRVQNIGNVSVDADIKTIIAYPWGSKLDEHEATYPILRGETSQWNFELEQPFWGGWYHATTTVDYNADPDTNLGEMSEDSSYNRHLESETVTFFAPPTAQGLIIETGAFLIVILLLATAVYRLKRRASYRQWAVREVGEGENIHTIAKETGTSWRDIARASRIKPPYSLQPGQQIRVPGEKNVNL